MYVYICVCVFVLQHYPYLVRQNSVLPLKLPLVLRTGFMAQFHNVATHPFAPSAGLVNFDFVCLVEVT